MSVTTVRAENIVIFSEISTNPSSYGFLTDTEVNWASYFRLRIGKKLSYSFLKLADP
jgi:hypothetical protein